MRGSIRLQITAIASAVVVLVLVITGVMLLYAQRRALTNNLDEILRTHSASIERDHRAGELPRLLTDQGDEDAMAQVADQDGHVLASTRNFAAQPALEPPPRGGSTLRTVRLPIDESEYRLMSRAVDGIVIHTGTPIDDVTESVAALRSGLLAAVPAAALILGVVVWWLVGRTLRPVELIRSQVAAISGSNLDRRVFEPATNDEVARLARTMNAMLDRVEEAARREQRFVADASHELRSPLTRMRAELEVDLEHPDGADLAVTHRSVLEEVDTLQRLVDDLLHLARSDGRASAPRSELVDLDELVLAHADQLRGTTNLDVATSCDSSAHVIGDPVHLRRALANLSDNAKRSASSRITISTRVQDGHVQIAVTDDGPGIPEDERARVFERFARLDAARASTDGGSGLGLAITLDIVQRHGGTIAVEEPEGGGATFIVTLPIAGP